MNTIEIQLTLHKANLEQMLREYHLLKLKTETHWINCQRLLMTIQDLERQNMPTAAVDLDGQGDPLGPNANGGTVQPFPLGRNNVKI